MKCRFSNRVDIVRLIFVSISLVLAIMFLWSMTRTFITVWNNRVAAGPQPNPETVVVGPGDTLWAIANAYYPGMHTGKVVHEIRKLNPEVDPGRLRVGQTVKLPQLN